uniref:Uncharacterized protein MANES_13G088800 n=1 Tax=Rhizophora mucronata TaxID=61149 RepID=A0A2P2KUI6_RHIMU
MLSMGEHIGSIKVMIVQGKKLAIRDFKSSDPYVVVKLGNQVLLSSMFFFLYFIHVFCSNTNFHSL